MPSDSQSDGHNPTYDWARSSDDLEENVEDKQKKSLSTGVVIGAGLVWILSGFTDPGIAAMGIILAMLIWDIYENWGKHTGRGDSR